MSKNPKRIVKLLIGYLPLFLFGPQPIAHADEKIEFKFINYQAGIPQSISLGHRIYSDPKSGFSADIDIGITASKINVGFKESPENSISYYKAGYSIAPLYAQEFRRESLSVDVPDGIYHGVEFGYGAFIFFFKLGIFSSGATEFVSFSFGVGTM